MYSCLVTTGHVVDIPTLNDGTTWRISAPLPLLPLSAKFHGQIRPTLVDDHSVIQWPCPLLLDGPSPPHHWHHVAGSLPYLRADVSYSCQRPKIYPKLQVPDVAARDVLSSFLDEYCPNDIFCVDLSNVHAIVRDSYCSMISPNR